MRFVHKNLFLTAKTNNYLMRQHIISLGKLNRWHSLVIILVAIILLACLYSLNNQANESIYKDSERYCRYESCPEIEGECNDDSDCSVGGCSGEVCAPKSKGPILTDCWGIRVDIDAACKCINTKCIWIK